MRQLLTSTVLFFVFIFSSLSASAQGPYLELLSTWQADPSNPHAYNDVWGWTSDDGKEYVVLGSLDSIYFFNVTDPKNPVLCDAEAGKYFLCIHRDFKTYKNYCYAVADEGNSSLQIFDMQYLPDSVHKVYDEDTLSTRAHNIFIEGDRLYFASNKIANQSGFEFHSMTVASLANPEAPELISHLYGIGQTPSFDHVHDVYVRNDTAYCSNGLDGFFIYDYTNPKLPGLIEALTPPYPHSGYNHSSWMTPDGKSIVFADETHGKALKLYDITGVKNGTTPGFEFENLFGVDYVQGSIPHNPFIKDNLVYVSYYHEGVVIFDISDPDNITTVAQYDTYPQNDTGVTSAYPGYEGCWGVYPFLPSGIIVASDMANGMFIFNLRNAGAIEEGDKKEPKVTLLANPFSSNGIGLQYNFEESTEVELALYDILGREKWHSRDKAAIGRVHYAPAEVLDLNSGEYILRVRAGSDIKVFKLIKW